MCCSVLQRVVVCSNVLQCVVVCCRVWQYAAVCCSALQCIAVHCSALQCIAVCCGCVAVCCGVLQCVAVHNAQKAKVNQIKIHASTSVISLNIHHVRSIIYTHAGTDLFPDDAHDGSGRGLSRGTEILEVRFL